MGLQLLKPKEIRGFWYHSSVKRCCQLEGNEERRRGKRIEVHLRSV